jgi:hypothetical protein
VEATTTVEALVSAAGGLAELKAVKHVAPDAAGLATLLG